jgi:uncharacterized protein (DUF983 family)
MPTSPAPIPTGLAGRCPRCGHGRLFDGFLTVAKSCESCGLDYGFADAADGPAVFGILGVGFIVVAGALWLEFTYEPPIWLHALIWGPLAIALSLVSLRLLKGVLIALQYANKAEEGRREER